VLGARFALGKARPCLVAAIYHIAPVFFAVYQKPIALGNGVGAVFLCGHIIPAAVIAVHRTHDGIAPYRQRQRREAQIHGKQQHGADNDEDGQGDVFTRFRLCHESTPNVYFLTHSYS
jgi:hypothetical protein